MQRIIAWLIGAKYTRKFVNRSSFLPFRWKISQLLTWVKLRRPWRVRVLQVVAAFLASNSGENLGIKLKFSLRWTRTLRRELWIQLFRSHGHMDEIFVVSLNVWKSFEKQRFHELFMRSLWSTLYNPDKSSPSSWCLRRETEKKKKSFQTSLFLFDGNRMMEWGSAHLGLAAVTTLLYSVSSSSSSTVCRYAWTGVMLEYSTSFWTRRRWMLA